MMCVHIIPMCVRIIPGTTLTFWHEFGTNRARVLYS